MADLAQKKVDKEIKKIEQQINAVYGQAQVEIEQKLKDFNDNFKIKKDIYYQKYKNHEITQTDYNSWRAGQLFQKQQWEAKRDQICQVLHSANEQATKIVNGGTISAFAIGANWTAYSLEHGANANFGFGIYDAQTVTNLLKNDPQILPQWKINEPKEYIWNKQKVNNCITQGIIQGESLEDITKRIAKTTCNANKNLAMTHTQTAMTAAQNSGRLQRLMDAKELGIKVVKEWMATLDGHTRDTHAKIDGEQKPVGDKWHHIKFSNGCEYPGDPKGPAHEVFNCRCTLVGDLEDYPEEYERYDNIDGKPIKNMTYEEWAKTKSSLMQPKMDTQTKKQLKAAKSTLDTAQNDLITKQKDLSQIENEIQLKGADTTFQGIWKDDVTYADWEDKKGSIEAKRKYYNDQINNYKNARDNRLDQFADALDEDADEIKELYDRIEYCKFHGLDEAIDNEVQDILEKMDYGIDDIDDISIIFEGVNKDLMWALDKLEALDEYEAHGEEYYKLLKKKAAAEAAVKKAQKAVDDAQKAVSDYTPKPKLITAFGDEAYTQARKDAALWAKTAKEADDVLRPTVADIWRNASQAERDAAYNYTVGSGKFNRPLRGYDGSWYSFKGIGNVPLDREHGETDINNLTNLVKRTKLTSDVWLQRGVNTEGLAGFLQVSESDLRNATQEELEAMLIGKEISDAAFMSCGSAKGEGFSGNIMNIYCPKGTQAIYAAPFSAYGGTRNWNGVSGQSYFGEDETILQRNTYYKVTKVEKKYNTIYVDVDIIDQRPDEWKYN